MHSLRGMRGLVAGLGFAVAALTAMPTPAHAGPDPEAKRTDTGRYRLFAGNLGAITINQIYYGLNTRGEVGVDSTNSSTIGGGYWPKGTGNQYMFNSGLQIAGIIAGDRATNPWAGDTTGAFFFDARGTNQNGTSATELYNAANPVDVANWPQAAYVPQGDASEELFDPLLRGRVSASQGDVWFLTAETDPGLNAGRPHPLGIVAEYRVMGWNFPTGNQDLLYLIITFYNVTTPNPAAYAQYRPGLRELLIEEAAEFKALNEANFNVTLPAEGYTINELYSAFAADPDVTGNAGTNFSSVNLPYALGYAYHADFPREAGWTFSPNIFGPPFLAATGIVGVKYLKSATGPGEINLFTNTCNGCGTFNDPRNANILFKYLSGKVTPADGVSCNMGDVVVEHICWVSLNATDVRFTQSSTPFSLEAGQSASIVVSYIHAAPVAIPGFIAGTRVNPGDPTRLTKVDQLSIGGGAANRIDSIMGFEGYSDANSDGIVQENEFTVVQGSLLQKASLAQSIFDKKFLLPFAPDAPDFFLVPGDGQVTVVWRPSDSENTGDPFYQVSKDASVVPEGGGAPVVNALYDPNYRQFDVEGYRIYRGRADNASALKLIAQYDYSGTVFSDYTGQIVNDARGTKCAPELGLTDSCAGVFDPQVPGTQLVKHVDYPISGNMVQVTRGSRTLLASGDVINLSTDTAVTGLGTGFPAVENTGVPFVYVDGDTRNGLTYFYAVTAYDINSINSTGAGNTSLSSALITKRIQPSTRAGNYSNEAVIETGMFGRNGLLTDNVAPTVDPATGIFSKKALPSNGATVELAAFVKELLTGPGEVSLTLDSIAVLSYSDGGNTNSNYYYTLTTPNGTSSVTVPIGQSSTTGSRSASGSFAALTADAGLATTYGAPEGEYGIGGSYSLSFPSGYFTTINDRGCVNFAGAYDDTYPACAHNGIRWFEGENATYPNPNGSNTNNLRTGAIRTDFNNVGGNVAGVTTMFSPRAYDDYSSSWRTVEQVLMPFISAADYKVYWGAAGVIDSVIDVTHDVVVPFSANVGATWGILNQSATQNGATYYDQRAELTVTDIGCVEPFKSLNPGGIACSGSAASLSNTAVPGAIAYGSGPAATSVERTSPTAAGQGFVFYLKGHMTIFELAGGVPAEGTVWTMRDYVGALIGGNGASGDGGNYSFSAENMPRPFSSVGSSVKFSFDLSNAVVSTTAASLAEVHTVPDPYYITSAFEATTASKQIKFVNLPTVATVRIYTSSGVLVRVLKQATESFGGEITWDVRNRNNQFVASGVYFYHVTAENGETMVGRMAIVNYAQ